MKNLKYLLISLIIVLVIVIAVLVWMLTAPVSIDAKATVSIEFVGENADAAGFAQSEISVTPIDENAFQGYYLLYYTDGRNVLEDYDELASVACDGANAVSVSIPDGMMIPTTAKGIAVFVSDTYFLEETPSINDAVAIATIPKEKRLTSLGDPEMTVGVLSDTHMNYQPYSRGAYEKLENSMNFFAQAQADCVVITGDVVGDRGESPDLEAQYTKHVDIIQASDFDFKNVYEAAGNHGNTPSDIPLLDKYLGGADEVHPYDGSPYYHVLFEGDKNERDNLFIFMAQEIEAPGQSATCDNFSEEQIDWVESLLKQYGETETNIFLIEHSPFLRYGAGDRENGAYTACVSFKKWYFQTMRLKKLLSTYKDVVVMSGHTHVTLYEAINYSNENGEFARTVHVGSNCQPCGYGEGTSLQRSYDGRQSVTPTYGSEGYLMEIYPDYIVYTGYNFSTNKKIPAACIIMPVTVNE